MKLPSVPDSSAGSTKAALDIASAFAAYVAKGQIWPDMWISGQELMWGFALSIVIGLPLGILIGWYRRLNQAFDPFIDMKPDFLVEFGTLLIPFDSAQRFVQGPCAR